MRQRARLYVHDVCIYETEFYDDSIITIFRDWQTHYFPTSDFRKIVNKEKWRKNSEFRLLLADKSELVKDKLELMGFSMDLVGHEYSKGLKAIGKDFGGVVQHFQPLLEKGIDPSVTSLDFGGDGRTLLRFITEFIPRDTMVIFDFTELGPWYFNDDKVSHEISEEELWLEEMLEIMTRMDELHDLEEKIIILGEGKTDVEFLRRSFDLLYPHLSSFFFFMDFKNSKAAGGAGHLVNLVKAFIGSGIRNKIIAIFDNDAAAENEMKNLEGINIPENFEVLKYPDLEFAKAYPAKGLNGDTITDINGKAGSIEFYLGEELLKETNGEFKPIQWKGYQQKVAKYQGTLIAKAEIQNAFLEKLKICESDRTKIQNYDWSSLELIFSSLRSAHQIHPIYSAFEDEEE